MPGRQQDHLSASPSLSVPMSADVSEAQPPDLTDVLAATAPERRLAPARRAGALKLALVMADCAALSGAALALGALVSTRAAIVTVLMLPVWLLVAKAHDLYDADDAKAWHLTTDEVPRLIYWATISLALTFVALSTAGTSDLDAGSAVVAFSIVLGVSASCRAAVRWLWRRIVPSERGLVVGFGTNATTVIRKLQLERGHHLEIVGQVALPRPDASGAEQIDRLRALIASTAAHRVIVATDELVDGELAPVLAACRAEGVKLSVAPPMRSVLGSSARLHRVAELAMVEMSTHGITLPQRVVKRTTDIVISSISLVLTLPVFVAIFALVRLESPGGALFRQSRAGRDGHPFTIIKFRTMCADAESRLDGIVDLESLDDPMFKIKDDPRVTRIGRWLRATSLDELPQLWNVLRGHMSLVGPRPEEMRVVARYDEATRVIRLGAKPGLTGPMQIHGRDDLTFSERLAVERDYAENYSLGRDLQILIRTVGVVLLRRGTS